MLNWAGLDVGPGWLLLVRRWDEPDWLDWWDERRMWVAWQGISVFMGGTLRRPMKKCELIKSPAASVYSMAV